MVSLVYHDARPQTPVGRGFSSFTGFLDLTVDSWTKQMHVRLAYHYLYRVYSFQNLKWSFI